MIRPATFQWPGWSMQELGETCGSTTLATSSYSDDLLSGYRPSLQAAIRRAKHLAASGIRITLTKSEQSPEQAPLFATARDAVKFAGSREGNPARPIASRMVDAQTGERELAGLDGTAQAGMVLNVLEGMGRVAVATLIASAVPRAIPCSCRRPCCAGYQVNRHWREAVDILAQAAADYTQASYALRWQLLTKIYVGKGNLKDIAEEVGMDEKTVGKHHKAICRWLRGYKEKDGETVEGVEARAWSDADTLLRQVGIVG